MAGQIYRQILAVEPNHPDALHLLGLIAHQMGKHEIAAEHINRAIAINGFEVAYHCNLGAVLQAQGKLEEAAACFRRALELKPDHAEAHYNLGNAYKASQELDQAVVCYRRALELRPDYVEALNNLGGILQAQKKFEESAATLRRTVELRPDFVAAHFNLGVALRWQGKVQDAIQSFRRAVELAPDYAEAHSDMGAALAQQGKLDEALRCLRRAVELKPDSADAHNNVGNVLKAQRKIDEAVASYRHAVQTQPDCITAHSNLLLALHYRPGITLAELAVAHAEYNRLHAEPLQADWPQPHRIRDPGRRLRLGFVSPDLCRHPVGSFLVRVLENLDPAECETVCYSDRITKDDLTARLHAAATIWHDVYGITDKQLFEMIRGDQVDVLFDLSGHTAANRLLLFARKPAPIQVTWAGYVGTTGLAAMDYILADLHEIPPHLEAHYVERVLRMPDGYICYDPPAHAPPVSALPAWKQGYVTLGSFNNPAKINRSVIEAWARILKRLPQSRLVLKYGGMDDASMTKGLADEFASHGVDPGRVECQGSSPHVRLLAEYHRVDLGLDPFPYNGGLTTCEALWMGVPVVTCPGETFAGRHSLSHLSNVGLNNMIASTVDDYVELAVAMAGDLPRLAALRADLRDRMAASPLCDGRRFAANLLVLLRQAWQQWATNENPQ